MSIGINDMQSSWQKLGMGSNFASLQTPSSLTSAQNSVSAQANIPGINSIEMPSWLQGGADSQMGELLGTYAGIGAAFDPTQQVAARNNAIGYNTSAGTQAANNAATEYSNRASQSGASGMGAGVVKAQAMMPMFSQNAALKIDAADTAAKAHREGTALASQIASTIADLRTSYLSTMTGYGLGQQNLALDKYKAEQATALGASQQALGFAGLQADAWKMSQSQRQQESDQARLAAMGLLNQQAPVGMYNTDNQGNVVSGQSTYDQIKNWESSRTEAQRALRGML